MAKIKLTGGETISVSREVAEEVAEKWRNTAWKAPIMINTREVKRSSIVGIDYGENSIEGEYDLSNPEVKAMLREFEREIAQFSGPWRWELYCVSKKYFVRAKIEKVGGFEKPENYAINGNLIGQYDAECKKKNALDELNHRRWYAKKMEHEAQLGGEKCDCVEYCHPMKQLKKIRDKVLKTPEPVKDDVCDKCGELLADCQCVKLEDVPF